MTELVSTGGPVEELTGGLILQRTLYFIGNVLFLIGLVGFVLVWNMFVHPAHLIMFGCVFGDIANIVRAVRTHKLKDCVFALLSIPILVCIGWIYYTEVMPPVLLPSKIETGPTLSL